MTEKDFFDKVWTFQKQCKELSEGNGGYKIRRGQAKVSSGYIEDLFALYLAKKIDNHSLEFFVDKVTSLKFSKNGKATTFKPDLSIINEENVLTDYFDVKTNLGWNREIENYIKKKNDFIMKIKGKQGWITFSKDEKKNISFSDNLKYKMVVIYGGNINQEQLKINIEKVKDFENVELYILYDHYNERINLEDFELLYSSYTTID
jgi:hypothetical protein